MKQSALFVALLMMAAPLFSYAHGYVVFPKARQIACIDNPNNNIWWPLNGSGIKNTACRQAFERSGVYPFQQKNEFASFVPDYTSLSAVESTILNGYLCAGGSRWRVGMDIASPAWVKTRLKLDKNRTFTLKFLATTTHNPSYWEIYLTKPGFNSGIERVFWEDLDLIASFGDLTATIDPNDGKRYYTMKVKIPAHRKGSAVLYTRWQRRDPAGEGFYNCSDINIVP